MGSKVLSESKLFMLKNKKTLLYVTATILVLMPALILLVQISKQAVDTPYQDQWELVPLIQSIDHGTFSPIDLWHLHNQHRLFFPRLIMLVSAYITHWNVDVEMIISWVLALACFVVLIMLMRRMEVFKKRRWFAFLAILTVATITFSFNQLENWLWGWQLQWYLCDLGVLLVILFLTKREALSRMSLVLAILSGVLATYSLASGQFIWLVGLLILWVLRKPIKVWSLAAIVVLASYFYHYDPVGYQTPSSYITSHPLSVIKYFFSYVGRPLTENGEHTYLIGLTGVIVMAAFIGFHIYKNKIANTRNSLAAIIAPLSLMIFSLCNGVVTSFSRSGLGFVQSLSSRYITISMLFWIGLLWLIAIVIYEHRKRIPNTDIVICSILCLFLGVAVTASVASAPAFTNDTVSRRAIKSCVDQSVPTDACLELTYSKPGVVRSRINYLKQKHWAGF